MSPLVSILIPAYNAAPWIGETLGSALAQTHPRCEIIVVDDGSQDDTLSRALGVAEANPGRIRVVSQSNAGASAARNHALRLACGEFIQYLDADDLLAPDKIALQLAMLADSPVDSLASGEWARFQTKPDEARFLPEPNWRDLSGIEFQLIHYEHGFMMQPAAWLSPRALLDRAGPWDEALTLNDDGEYFSRVMLKASGIRFCSGARVFYRSGIAGSLSRQKSRRALQSLWKSTELNCERLIAHAGTSPRALAAAANGWQRMMFESWPQAPDLSRAAEKRRDSLGGSPFLMEAGPNFRVISRFFGWRAAKRLRDLTMSLRS